MLLWLLSPAERPAGDAAVMSGVARNIAVHGEFDFGYRSPGYTVEGVDGRFYAKYPIAWSLVLTPGQYVEWVVSSSSIPITDKELYIRLVKGITPALTGALSVLFLFLTIVTLGYGRRVSLVATTAFHFATCALPYLRSTYSEVLLIAAVNLAFLGLAVLEKRPRARSAFLLGLSCGILMLSKPTLFPVSAVVLLCGASIVILSGSGILRQAAITLFGLAGPVAVALSYNYLRFGEMLTLDYGYYPVPLGLDHPLPDGLFGLLLSPGRGLFWYAPVVLLSLAGIRYVRRGALSVTITAAAASLSILLLHSMYTIWHGAEQWGPRFLVPMVGPLAIMAAPYLARTAAGSHARRTLPALLVAVGLVVNVPGVLIHHMSFFKTVPYKPYSELRLDANGMTDGPVEKDNLYLTNYVPMFSPIRGHWWLLLHALSGGELAEDCPWAGLITDRPSIRQDIDPELNLWFLPRPEWPPGSRTTGYALLAAMLIASVGAWYEVLRRTRNIRTAPRKERRRSGPEDPHVQGESRRSP